MIIAALAVSVVLVVISLMFYAFWYVKEVRVVKMSVEVNDHMGFDTNTSLLTFGMVMPGSESVRTIILGHDRDYPMKASITSYGDISDWVFVSDNNFIVHPNETVALNVKVMPPIEVAYGNYTGYLKIIFTG